jgi:hypothetical protein
LAAGLSNPERNLELCTTLLREMVAIEECNKHKEWGEEDREEVRRKKI